MNDSGHAHFQSQPARRKLRYLLAIVPIAALVTAYPLFHRSSSVPSLRASSRNATVVGSLREEHPILARNTSHDQLVEDRTWEREKWTRATLLTRLRAMLSDGSSTDDILSLLKSVAQDQGELAMETANLVARNGVEKFTLVDGVTEAWSASDPSAVWAWAMTAPAGDNLPSACVNFDHAIQHMAVTDPDGLVARLEAALKPGGWPSHLASDLSLDNLLSSAADAMCSAGSGDRVRSLVESWAQSFSKEQYDLLPLNAVASHLAKTAPRAAAEWLKTMPDCAPQGVASSSVASEWIKQQPYEAMEWALSLEGGPAADTIEGAYSDWLELNQASAKKWLLDRFQKGTAGTDLEGDRMIVSLLHKSDIRQSEPLTALQLAGSIADADIRQRSLEDVIRGWHRADPAAALRYVANTAIFDAGEKQGILTLLRTDLDDDDVD